MHQASSSTFQAPEFALSHAAEILSALPESSVGDLAQARARVSLRMGPSSLESHRRRDGMALEVVHLAVRAAQERTVALDAATDRRASELAASLETVPPRAVSRMKGLDVEAAATLELPAPRTHSVLSTSAVAAQPTTSACRKLVLRPPRVLM